MLGLAHVAELTHALIGGQTHDVWTTHVTEACDTVHTPHSTVN